MPTDAPPLAGDGQGRAAGRYSDLECERQPFLDRARDCSKFTLPPLIPPNDSSTLTDLYKPYQSIGARGVNNLASKLVLALLPPTRKFFRLVTTDELDQNLQPNEKSEMEVALSKVEDRLVQHMETLGLRPSTFELFRHLVVSGNAVLYVGTKGVRVFPLMQYVCRRDPEGALLEMVLKEVVAPDTVPETIREQVKTKTKGEKNIPLYTHIERDGNRFKVYQEVAGFRVPGSEGNYPEEKLPWLVLRWTRIDGESYGRGLCDDYLGDLIAAEGLSKAILESAAIAAKTIFLVNPNGMTDPDDLAKTENGGFADGIAEEVTALGVEKFADMQVARSTLEDVFSRLSYAFLLNSAVRRQGERVTAEEIRYMAQELEDALGGVYSVLSIEFQLRVVELVIGQLERSGKMPPLPKNLVRPTVITGIDALGRSHELARLDAFVGDMIKTFGPEALVYINMTDLLQRRAAGLDIDPKGLIRTEDEVGQMRQAQAQQQMTEKLGGPAIKAISDNNIAAQSANGNNG